MNNRENKRFIPKWVKASFLLLILSTFIYILAINNISVADFVNRKYGEGTVELTIRDSYYNMREKIEPCMYIVERAVKAMEEAGMTVKTVPIRGGTDGARLSYEGLLCPNLCTGGENYHGRFEYIPIEDMEICVQMLIQLLTIF